MLAVEARARRVEQSRQSLRAALVFEQHEEREGALVNSEQCACSMRRGLRGCSRRVVRLTRCARIVEEAERVLQPGEGVEQFEARLRLSLAQSRKVATTNAATCDFEIVARATGDARQLRLSLVEFASGRGVRERKRESGVAFYVRLERVRGGDGCIGASPA
jgi:hypothetical protein